MSKAIYTIMLGNDPAFKISKKIFQDYAARVGAELHICTKPYYSIGNNKLSFAKAAWMQIFYVGQLLQQYERVLYIDADILITPHAKNIFTSCPRLDTTYLYNEGELLQCQSYLKAIDDYYQTSTCWATAQQQTLYFNTGVLLTSRQAQLFQHLRQEDLQRCYDKVPLYQQTYINYLLQRQQLSYSCLPVEFNRMEYAGPAEQRFDASFIHYAGNGYCSARRDRSWQLIEDYEFLYQGHSRLSVAQQLKYQSQFVQYRLARLLKRLLVRPLYNPKQYWLSKWQG